MPESFDNPCGCDPMPGTTPPVAPYVVSIGGLQGIVLLDGTGALEISTLGNTIIFGLAAGSGLGTVTSVNASSSNSNLTVTGGPITTNGSFTFNLAGALSSISGLVTAADKMIYTTASNTYAVTDLTSFARTLLDDANNTAARSTLGLVIGTNVQAWSQDLDDFVTNVSWSGDDFTSSGGATFGDAVNVSGALTATGLISGGAGASISGNVTAGTFTGDGSALTNLDAGDIASGTLPATRGGTGFASYTVGDIIYASTTTAFTRLNAGAAGTFLRFAGAGVAPVVSTLILPNAGTTGDIFHATASNTMGRLSAVATGNVLLSGGVATISAWGKVTSGHVDSTIATISGGSNANITTLTALSSVTSIVAFADEVELLGPIRDFNGNTASGGGGGVLTSTGSNVEWSDQIALDTLIINTRLSIEGTLTAGGTTGNQTINKPSGTVRFAGAATSLTVTNNLCTSSDRVLACVCTNDATAYVKNVTTTTGAFTIVLGAAATGETEVYWELIRVS
jgi:hypothetical protein